MDARVDRECPKDAGKQAAARLESTAGQTTDMPEYAAEQTTAVQESAAGQMADIPMGISAGGIRSYFDLPEQDIHTYSPLTLAYIGDSIFDLVIRTMMVERGNQSVNRLHTKTSRLVRAHAQSAMAAYLMPELSPEEVTVYRRGRNAKSYTMAKNATVADYRRATGFEALMGWLYLSGRTERMLWLIRRGLSEYQKEPEGKR